MQTLGKFSFVLAPIFLFASFISSAVLQNNLLMSIFIVLATLFLIFAVIGKAREERRAHKEEKDHD